MSPKSYVHYKKFMYIHTYTSLRSANQSNINLLHFGYILTLNTLTVSGTCLVALGPRNGSLDMKWALGNNYFFDCIF
jgi:hypothetical protein